MQRHLLVTLFQTNNTSRRCVVTVVVGSVTGPLSKDVPQVIALAPVPVIASSNLCPSVGVPERLVVNDVISTVWAVIEK